MVSGEPLVAHAARVGQGHRVADAHRVAARVVAEGDEGLHIPRGVARLDRLGQRIAVGVIAHRGGERRRPRDARLRRPPATMTSKLVRTGVPLIATVNWRWPGPVFR